MNFSNEEYNIPGYVDATNFKFIDFDNKFLAGIVIKKLPNMFNFLDVIKAIPKNEIYDLAIYISKKDSSKVLKEISYYISSSSSEQKTVNKNQVDIDILSKVKEDAKELRRAIQIDGEDIFYINILFTFVCTDKFELLRCVKDFRGKLYSKGIISNVLNFRHLDAYKLTLPLGYVENKILDKTYMNVTTSLLSYIFPFYKTNIFDEDGVIFGYTIDDNKICNINIFDNKYINSNVCIFGSSGSGKSYFTKINIIRNYLNGISQYVFDIEGEYINIAKNLKINYLSIYGDLPYFYNIFEIYDYELNYKNSFKNKVDEITKFINKLCKIDKQDLLDELKNSILKMYYEFNIINSNYILNDAIKYKSKDFPTLKDLLKFLKSKKLKNLIQNNILNKFYFLTSHTNIDLSNRLFIVNVKNITEESLYIVNFILNQIKKKIKNENRSLIYIDEVWKYISKNDNLEVCNNIFELYKTIRKSKAGIITITQDISDFFAYENGNYGKSILNNSAFKIFFKTDYNNLNILSKLSLFDENVIKNITRLDKGQALVVFSNNVFVINIKSNEYEKEIINEG